MEWREKTVDHLTAAAHRATAEKQTSDALSRCAGYLEDLGWGQQPTRALACAAGWREESAVQHRGYIAPSRSDSGISISNCG